MKYATKRNKSVGDGDLAKAVLSVEVYLVLLCRFHVAEFVVLATWDPCAMVQAAAVQIDVDSIFVLVRTKRLGYRGLLWQ